MCFGFLVLTEFMQHNLLYSMAADETGPNTAWLLVVCVFMLHHLLSLNRIIYVTWYTSHLPQPTGT